MRVYPAVSTYPIFKHPHLPLKQKVNKKDDLETISPPEFKAGLQRVSFNEVIKINPPNNPPSVTRKREEEIDADKWINHLFSEKALYGQYIVDLQILGYSAHEAKDIVDQAIYHTERATNSAIEHEVKAGISANSMLLSAAVGILSNLVKNSDSTPRLIKQALNITKNAAIGLRGYLQYELYGRSDDDRGKNKYQAEFYGNKISGIFSDLAYIFETKINPVALVTLSFTGEKTQNIVKQLLTLPSTDWWRVRTFAEINQQFGTDLFGYLLHKPLSL